MEKSLISHEMACQTVVDSTRNVHSLPPPDSDISILYQQALVFHQQNRFSEVKHKIDSTESLVYLQTNITDSDADILFQQGFTFHQQGVFACALQKYQQVISLDPNHAGTLHALGLIDLQQDNFQKACDSFEKAIAACPDKAVYKSNYGVTLLKLGKTDEAKSILESALKICPDHPGAMYNLGVVCFEKQEYDQAIALLEQLLSQCDFLQAIPLLIEALCKQKMYEKAFAIYQSFTDKKKIVLGAMDKIASVFHQGKQYDFTIRVTKDAIQYGGEMPHRALHLAWAHGDNEQYAEAKSHYAKAAALRSDRPLWKYKHLGLCPTVFDNTDEIREYWQELNESLDEVIQNPPTMEIRHAFEDGVMPSFNLPHLMYCCREVKEKFGRLIRPSFKDYHPPKLPKSGKIRVGFFVSGGHQGGCLRSDTGLMKRLDRKKFEPVFITGQDVLAHCKCSIRSNNVEYVGISSNFEETTNQIRELKCHILYHWQTCSDLMNYLIPFARCVPVQIAGFGMHGTTGTEEIDYFMSSKFLEPVNGEQHYTEKLIRCNELPTWQDHIEKSKFQAKRSDFDLPEKGAVYFCPHRLPKFHPDFDRFLRDILETDTKGHLVILDNGHKHAMAKLRSRWEKVLGKQLMSRILMRPQMMPLDYYRLISVSSCVLDSPCYSTSFTGFDTLSLGVPLIGLQGNIMVQRYASAFYKRMNLDDFIPKNRKEYVTLAVTVSNDREFRRHFLELLDERKEILFENRRSVYHFEEVLERIHAETDYSG